MTKLLFSGWLCDFDDRHRSLRGPPIFQPKLPSVLTALAMLALAVEAGSSKAMLRSQENEAALGGFGNTGEINETKF